MVLANVCVCLCAYDGEGQRERNVGKRERKRTAQSVKVSTIPVLSFGELDTQTAVG